MTENAASDNVKIGSVSDRGLNDRRPLNEDALLINATTRIFAVADGVGGAQAGEVASRTAVEILEEAFTHYKPGDDIEDLMELAIQQANSSIHKMAHEQPKLRSMATTIVALHLDGRNATIAHVGDSRLYRLAPNNTLHRETQDHSIVEEEVRAGRMTVEQAATHPNRNVISRALGAEPSVEVELKTIEVIEGTKFLLCSDGITRHLSDAEIRDLLARNSDPARVCGEMKELCYRRGAEDNLTALVVEVPNSLNAGPTEDAGVLDEEPTLITERRPMVDGKSSELRLHASAGAPESGPATAIGTNGSIVTSEGENDLPNGAFRNSEAGKSDSRAGLSFAVPFLIFFVLIGTGAVTFFAGTIYQMNIQKRSKSTGVAALAAGGESSKPAFENEINNVDSAPGSEALRMEQESNGRPLDSKDPGFLYLYGRAKLLSGDYAKALNAFEEARKELAGQPGIAVPTRLRVDVGIASAAATLKSNSPDSARAAQPALDSVNGNSNSPVPTTSITPH